MNTRSLTSLALEHGGGILRLAPTWVPRFYWRAWSPHQAPPRRLLRPRRARGGFDERWLSSTTPANNGPLTAPHEGLSFVVLEDGGRTEKILSAMRSRNSTAASSANASGRNMAAGRCTRSSSDNMGALPHHVHHRDSTRHWSGRTESRSRITSRPDEQPRRGFSLQRSSASSPAPRGTRSASAW